MILKPILTNEQRVSLDEGNWLSLIEPGREYYWRRTDGWDWFGTRHWWEVFVVFHDGFNGGGRAFLVEHWRWNNSQENIRQDPKNLTYDQTIKLVRELFEWESESIPSIKPISDI